MISPRCLMLSLLAGLGASFLAVRGADGDGLQAATASEADAPPHVSSPELRPPPGPPPVSSDAAIQPGPTPQATADAPSGTEASTASEPLHSDPPSAADLGPKTDASGSDTPPPPSSNVTMNLINLMVKRGLITKEDAQGLVQQAEQEASSAQGQTAAPPTPAQPVNGDDDTVRVDYVPDNVKEQIRDEVKDEVMSQARTEGWAAPDSIPDWVKRYHVTADLRVRYEGDFFPTGNDDSGDFHNFNSINTGSPFDTGVNSVAANPPSYDTDQDRNRFRLRARFGAGIDVGDGFTAGLRLGTGQDDNPVTENQTIGLANNGQGGDFSKYAVWLDRAFLRYEVGGTPDQDLAVTVGRFENPFFSTSMIWAYDIGFDGLAVAGHYKVANGVTPFFTVGGFPVFNTDFNFGTTSAAKFPSEDKYLFAAQAGTNWQIAKDISFKVAAAIYYFEAIEGKVSSPFTPLFPSDSGDTDDTRPSFAQNGNTYIALRDIVPNASNDFGLINQYQYYGLATPFHDADLIAQVDFSQFDPFHISVQADVVKNVAFDRRAIEKNGPPQQIGPVNNLEGRTFDGGDAGYDVRLIMGQPILAKRWDWNINLTYRYVESDATPDGFTDADFGGPLTGTNLKGYIIGANLGLTSRVWTSLQFMSADAIAGPVYKNDLIQVDINAKF